MLAFFVRLLPSALQKNLLCFVDLGCHILRAPFIRVVDHQDSSVGVLVEAKTQIGRKKGFTASCLNNVKSDRLHSEVLAMISNY